MYTLQTPSIPAIKFNKTDKIFISPSATLKVFYEDKKLNSSVKIVRRLNDMSKRHRFLFIKILLISLDVNNYFRRGNIFHLQPTAKI